MIQLKKNTKGKIRKILILKFLLLLNFSKYTNTDIKILDKISENELVKLKNGDEILYKDLMIKKYEM